MYYISGIFVLWKYYVNKFGILGHVAEIVGVCGGLGGLAMSSEISCFRRIFDNRLTCRNCFKKTF